MDEAGTGGRLICPACGTQRVAGARFCANCGLDYWRTAAGDPVVPVKRPRRARVADEQDEFIEPVPFVPAPATGPAGMSLAATPTVRVARRKDRIDQIEELGQRLAKIPRRTKLITVGVVALALFLVIVRPFPQFGTAAQPASAVVATPPSANAVVNAFFKTVRAPDATFAVKVTGSVSISAAGKQSKAPISADLVVNGDDLSGTMRVAGFSGSVVRIGQASWERTGSGAWKLRTLPADAESVNPFRWIATVDELTYVEPGPEQAGQRTHRLTSSKWLSGTQYDALLATMTDVDRQAKLDVEATDAGVPLHATYQFSIRGKRASGGAAFILSGSIEYAFSRWGQPIAIKPPV
jgi:hypothetical protein